MSAKRWCFTLNNYTTEEWNTLITLPKTDFKYIICGEEVGDQGTRHVQGYFHLLRKKRLAAVKTLIGERAHLEIARGSDRQNRNYCKKGGQFFEWGEFSDGTPLQQIANIVLTGSDTIRDIAVAYPEQYIRSWRGIKELFSIARLQEQRDYKTEVFVLWGGPGTGKSRWCRSQCNDIGIDAYYKPRGLWWDGYTGQPTVVIDDFYGWIPYDELLKCLDRYPHRVEFKGGYWNFNPRRIYITSNKPPQEWYRFTYFDPQPLLRRIEHLIHVDQPINFQDFWLL